MKNSVVVLLIAFILVACSSGPLAPPTPTLTCAEQSAEYVAAADDILERWFDAVQLADSTSRIALSPAIASLQSIRRDLNDLERPNCAEFVHSALISHMDAVIDGFIAFMSDESDDVISGYFDEAEEQMGNYLRNIDNIRP